MLVAQKEAVKLVVVTGGPSPRTPMKTVDTCLGIESSRAHVAAEQEGILTR